MRGYYGRQVKRLMDEFGPDSILVLQYERCVREPAAEFTRTLEFIGASPWLPDERHLTRRYNATVGDKGSLSGKDEAALVEEYEPEVALLKELVPDLDLSLWPRFEHLEKPIHALLQQHAERALSSMVDCLDALEIGRIALPPQRRALLDVQQLGPSGE